MQIEDYFDFLPSGDIRIKGHRIGIEHVLVEYIHRVMTPKQLAERFPSLNMEKIFATLLYYHQNQERVDQYLEEWFENGRRMREEQQRNPTPAMLRLRKVRAERDAAERELLEARLR